MSFPRAVVGNLRLTCRLIIRYFFYLPNNLISGRSSTTTLRMTTFLLPPPLYHTKKKKQVKPFLQTKKQPQFFNCGCPSKDRYKLFYQLAVYSTAHCKIHCPIGLCYAVAGHFNRRVFSRAGAGHIIPRQSFMCIGG